MVTKRPPIHSLPTLVTRKKIRRLSWESIEVNIKRFPTPSFVSLGKKMPRISEAFKAKINNLREVIDLELLKSRFRCKKEEL